jgi:hypothetical protein
MTTSDSDPDAPGWAPDPLGHHEFRWWDGQRWTDQVAGHDVHAGFNVGRIEDLADKVPFDLLRPAQRTWQAADVKAYAEPVRFHDAFGAVTMPTDDLRNWEVAGEGEHQLALDRIAGPKTSEGVWVETVAALRPEPDNPADPEAIAVVIDDQRVGYLGRHHAAGLRELIEAATARDGAATCGAVVNGGWRRPEDHSEGSYGVRLYLGDQAL